MDEVNKRMISEFKAEIIRLGLEKGASRTKYAKLRSNDAPSPTTMMDRLDQSWNEIVTECGFEAKTVSWKNADVEDVYQAAAQFVTENGIKSSADYIEKCDVVKTPSFWVVQGAIGWPEFRIRYQA
ncbi:hypothetical protein C5Z25_01230 [Lactobacillus sp. CBA3605]|uniref:hypothetical protein n=1 Tax=Lactobacillus sp. CBA3605 TaxID=2099788 RepID=UPI000CFC26A7|nr:hypothetical protein [Lactobacillus sp. CBA3605]AVK60480.1 hypothetical protein C5Z25_01230 [Lactobacillus sp. CBA3605]